MKLYLCGVLNHLLYLYWHSFICISDKSVVPEMNDTSWQFELNWYLLQYKLGQTYVSFKSNETRAPARNWKGQGASGWKGTFWSYFLLLFVFISAICIWGCFLLPNYLYQETTKKSLRIIHWLVLKKVSVQSKLPSTKLKLKIFLSNPSR